MRQQIPEDVELKFIGIHEDGKTDNDVTVIYFDSSKFTRVPQRLLKKFANLEILQILSSHLKNISNSDLIEYKKFKEIDFSYNKIKYLPGDMANRSESTAQIFLEGV